MKTFGELNMKITKLILVSLLLLTVTVSAASAADTNTTLEESDSILTQDEDTSIEETNQTETIKEDPNLVVETLNTVYPWSWADSDSDSGHGVDINLRSYDWQSQPKGNLSIYLDNKILAKCQDKSGYHIDEETLWKHYTDNGYHRVKVVYSGDGQFNPKTKTCTFYLKAYSCSLTKKGTVKLSLPSDVEGKLTVKANGKTICSKRISGTYENIYSKYREETHKVQLKGLKKNVKYRIDIYFKGKTHTVKYSIRLSYHYKNGKAEKIYPTPITLKTATVKKSAKNLTLTATLKKSQVKYITGKTIKFKFNKKTYYAKTDSNGVAKVTLKKSAFKNLKAGSKVTYQATFLKTTIKKTAKVKK